MKYNKGFAPLVLVAIIIGVLIISGGAYYLGTKNNSVPKNEEENNFLQENQIVDTSYENSSERIITPTDSLTQENVKTPLFIKSIYKKDGKWWADVDYITKVTPLEHMTKAINEGFCVIPGMTKNEMFEYAKNTVKNYVEQDNLLVVKCGYDWQGIWSSDGAIPTMFINSNPLIRSLPFADKIEREIKICGVSSISVTTPEKIKMEVDNRRGLDYSFDPYIQTYNTKGHLEELVNIENGQIKKFYGPDSCAG